MISSVQFSLFTNVIIYTFVLILFTGCCSGLTRIQKDFDAPKEEARFSLKYKPKVVGNSDDYINKTEQTFLKIANVNGQFSYHIYDKLFNKENGFGLEDTIYIMTDVGNFPIRINRQSLENNSSIEESTEEIMKMDSTTTTVVTGYTLKQNKNIYLNYRLSKASVKAILNTEYLSFRYYMGPAILTTEVCKRDLKKLKAIMKLEAMK